MNSEKGPMAEVFFLLKKNCRKKQCHNHGFQLKNVMKKCFQKNDFLSHFAEDKYVHRII